MKLHKATLNKYRRNATIFINSLTTPEKYQACHWYRIARQQAEEIGKETDFPIDIVCKVIAVLSVGINWKTNLKDARNLLNGYNRGIAEKIVVSTYKANKQKAINIINQTQDLLPSAKKTYAFYRNILNPYEDDTLTIDRHAYKALNGISKGGAVAISLTEYRKLETGYKILAEEYNLHPVSFQAMVWEGYKKHVKR